MSRQPCWSWIFGICATSLAATGCTRAPGRGAEACAHFVKVTDSLRAGNLTQAFSNALSPSQQADLNSLLTEARGLVEKEDYEAFQAVLKTTGPKLASLCALRASTSPALGVLGSKARDLSKALGFDSFESFQKRDIKGVVEAIDKGFASDLLKAEDVKARLESLQVSVIAEEGDWAKLRFAVKSPDGSVTEEIAEVISGSGTWLPTSWVSDWGSTLEGLRSEVAGLKEAKKQDPELVRKAIADLSRLLDDPAALMSLFAPQAAPQARPAAAAATGG